MQQLLLIGLAGLIGTLCRYGLSELITKRFGETFPTGTLIVNILGCFCAGVFFYFFIEKSSVGEMVKTTVMIGFLGGFTTFSSFGLQTFNLVREGQVFWAATYVVLSNAIGLGSVWLGYSLSKWV
jgi:fluoride exporter